MVHPGAAQPLSQPVAKLTMAAALTQPSWQFGLMAGSVFLGLLADLQAEGLQAEHAAINGTCAAGGVVTISLAECSLCQRSCTIAQQLG